MSVGGWGLSVVDGRSVGGRSVGGGGGVVSPVHGRDEVAGAVVTALEREVFLLLRRVAAADYSLVLADAGGRGRGVDRYRE